MFYYRNILFELVRWTIALAVNGLVCDGSLVLQIQIVQFLRMKSAYIWRTMKAAILVDFYDSSASVIGSRHPIESIYGKLGSFHSMLDLFRFVF